MHLIEKINAGGIYTIAEMSANHAGSIERAKEIIHEAKKAGADCVKIQTYTPDTITIDCNNEYFKINGGLWDGYRLYDLYKEAYTPWDWQFKIKEECDKCEIDFLSTPFDNTAIDFLEKLGCEAYKIASFEIVDLPLIEYASSKGKPILISCGMASFEEITEAINICKKCGNENIILLKCCSEYPTNPKNMNLATIKDMRNKFGVPVGLSDHSLGYLADVSAVGYGACVIEKHFCISRTIKNADSEFSMEPSEFSEMIHALETLQEMQGSVFYGPTVSEKEEYKCRRSLFAVDQIKKGEVFTLQNIRSIRPNNGISPKYLNEIIGKKALQDICFGSPLSWEMVDKT